MIFIYYFDIKLFNGGVYYIIYRTCVYHKQFCDSFLITFMNKYEDFLSLLNL